MTKKDYIQFANMLKRIRLAITANRQATPRGVLQLTTEKMCDIFRQDNSKFDRRRFIGWIDK